MTDLMALVLALEQADVLPRLDAEGAMYALQGLQELEEKGWVFTPPKESEPAEGTSA